MDRCSHVGSSPKSTEMVKGAHVLAWVQVAFAYAAQAAMSAAIPPSEVLLSCEPASLVVGDPLFELLEQPANATVASTTLDAESQIMEVRMRFNSLSKPPAAATGGRRTD
jgi:hypothetical protein